MKSPTADAPVEKRRTRFLLSLATTALVTYLLVVLAMTFLETSLVYPAPPLAAGDWQPAGLDYEDIWFTSADGTKLHGWFVPHPSPKRAIVYCHGNGEFVAFNADLAALLRDALDASVFLFDYRGYGRSEGRPHEAGCIADGIAAQRWLAERMGAEPKEIVVMGRSLGAAVAAAMAAELGAKALVLENGFSRMTDVAAHHYPWLPVRLVMHNRYDSLQRIADYHGPLLQSHGVSDWIVPIRFARQLFDAAPSQPKRFLEFNGQDHNDSFPPGYYRQLREFLDDISAGTGENPAN
jgi:uncharacterized protein